jgi:transcriptional regulator with XRE-family HTH domain
MHTGEKIKRMREIKGYTQKQIADYIGTSVNNYSRLERGEIDVTVDRLEKISKVLEVGIEDILKIDEGFNVVINNSKDFYVTKTLNIYSLQEKLDALENKIISLEEQIKKIQK